MSVHCIGNVYHEDSADPGIRGGFCLRCLLVKLLQKYARASHGDPLRHISMPKQGAQELRV